MNISSPLPLPGLIIVVAKEIQIVLCMNSVLPSVFCIVKLNDLLSDPIIKQTKQLKSGFC